MRRGNNRAATIFYRRLITVILKLSSTSETLRQCPSATLGDRHSTTSRSDRREMPDLRRVGRILGIGEEHRLLIGSPFCEAL